MSFSHFLPRAELLPEKRTLFYPPLAKAVGSLPLRERVRALRPDLHVFGHTHYAWAAEVEGTRFLQACLAYPREREERPFSVKCGDGSGYYQRFSGARCFSSCAFRHARAYTRTCRRSRTHSTM